MASLEDQLIEASRILDGAEVKRLLKLGADVHAREDFALRCAISHENIEMVRLLLDLGADANTKNHYPLWIASLRGNINLVRLLLDYGADANGWEYQPLIAALSQASNKKQDRMEIADILLQRIFQPQAWQNKTAADYAAKVENIFNAFKKHNGIWPPEAPDRISPQTLKVYKDKIMDHAYVKFHAIRREQVLKNPFRTLPPISPRPL